MNSRKHHVDGRGWTAAAASSALAVLVAFASAAPRPPAEAHRVELAARAFAPGDVRLLDGPFQAAQRRDGEYLLSLDADRLLSGFRSEAGLAPKAPKYGGWEGEAVAGHTLGHYLSAVSLLYADTGDERFKRQVDYVVAELAECQAANGDGYVAAIPGGKRLFDEIRSGDVRVTGGDGSRLNGVWVPLYTLHKVYAGLIDARRHAGSDRAQQVLIGLGDWAVDTFGPLSDAQMQRMLESEQGGLNESFADLYAMTGEAKYLRLAERFTHKAVIDPLAAGQDKLDGLHANTQVPKVIGTARLYELTGDAHYRDAARQFWDEVVGRRTYAQGGNSDYEHFFPPGQSHEHLTGATAETCNVYNMLRLTKELFQLEPSRGAADYYERALFNQILGGVDPRRGMFTYFQSLRPGGFKVYSDPTAAFWCCVGTGMENPARYAEAIYFRSDDALWVNLFVASELAWKDRGVTLRQETQYPDEPTTTLTVGVEKPTRFALKLRVPAWVSGEPKLSVNGEQATPQIADGYATIDREWKDGDKVEWTVPMAVRTEPLEGAADEVALVYGPSVLAGQLGTSGLDNVDFYLGDHAQKQYASAPVPDVPSLIGPAARVAASARRTGGDGDPLAFELPTADGGTVTLRPFAATHFVRYTVYWHVFADTAAYAAQHDRLAAAAEARRQLNARTVDTVRPGEQQPEADHRFRGERSVSGAAFGGHWRDARDGGFFEYEMRLDPAAAGHELRVQYWGGDGGGGDRVFDVLVDGRRIAAKSLHAEKPGAMIEDVYPVPVSLTNGKSHVVIRFQAKPGKTAGGVFGLRLLKLD